MSLLLFVVATQFSCINDAEVDAPGVNSDSNGNLALFFEIPNTTYSRSVGSFIDTDEGTKEEYAVNSVMVYLYDSATKILVDSYSLENIQSIGTGQRIQYTAKKINVKPGKYNIFAIANGKAVASDIGTQDKFLGAIDATTYNIGNIPTPPVKGFVMTNRGAANLNVEVIEPTSSNNVTNVSISLERVVAKMELTQTQEIFELKDKDENTYASIKLTNFKMMNLATRFYTFRHTAVLTSLQEPDEYTDVNFGEIDDPNSYIIDPYFFQKTEEGAKDFTNADLFYTQAFVDDKNNNVWAGMGQANNWSHIYCLENCMFQSAQMHAYTTGVMFKATIAITPGRIFDENGPVTTYANVFYFQHNFYTSVHAIRLRYGSENIPNHLNDNSSTEELGKYYIKSFKKAENYSCYYNYWIKHIDNGDKSKMGVMEFGIVRNNIYRLSITKVKELGSNDPIIDPETPNETDAELDIKFDVFPWAVRKQDVELE